MTTTLPPIPTRPAQPWELRDLIGAHNGSMAALNGAIRGMRSGDPFCREAIDRYSAEVVEWNKSISEWYATEDGQAYRAAVNAYNAKVDVYNAALKRARQARKNAREVAQVRSASCPRCFTTHAGEC